MPGNYPATIKALECNGKSVKQAAAGDSVDVGLHGVEANQLLPGGALCHPDHPIPVATRVEAQILTAEIRIPILRGSQVRAELRAWKVAQACDWVSLTSVRLAYLSLATRFSSVLPSSRSTSARLLLLITSR